MSDSEQTERIAQYDPNQDTLLDSEDLPVQPKKFRSANRVYKFIWLHKNKDLVKLGDYYYTPASKSTELKSREIKMFIATRNDLSWDDFNDFAAMENSIWRTKIIESDWKESSCTCPFFSKNYKCKHIIGISNRLRFTGYPKIPLESITIMPEERRKRGRPALAKGALIRQ